MTLFITYDDTFQIVDRFSSTIDLPNKVLAGIPANHVNMTKFESSTDQGFIRVRSALQRWTKDLRQRQHYDGKLEDSQAGPLSPA